MTETFSVSECIRFGWESFKSRAWFLVGITLVYGVASWIISAIGGGSAEVVASRPDDFMAGGVSFLITFPLGIFLSMCFAGFWLKAHDKLPEVTFKTLWNPHPFWKFLGAKILSSIAVIIGLVLLIIPGIILAIAFIPVPYLVLERKLGPIEALKESWRITKGHRWQIALLLGALLGLNLLGLLALVVGLLVTVPISALATVHAYRFMEHRANEMAPAGAAQ